MSVFMPATGLQGEGGHGRGHDEGHPGPEAAQLQRRALCPLPQRCALVSLRSFSAIHVSRMQKS